MNQQRGSTLVGFILGLVLGLAVALGVAVYVTKVPMPFMNKGQAHRAGTDASEEEKNKHWDPNAPLYGKNPTGAGGKEDTAEPVGRRADGKANERKPDAALKVDPKSADPVGDLAKAKSQAPSPKAQPPVRKASEATAAQDATYFVQVGAYIKTEEAQAQRAKVALLGLDAKLSERDQSGHIVYRVRIGPMSKSDAERAHQKLEAAQMESVLVRVQR